MWSILCNKRRIEGRTYILQIYRTKCEVALPEFIEPSCMELQSTQGSQPVFVIWIIILPPLLSIWKKHKNKKNTFDLLLWCVIPGIGTLFICVMVLKKWLIMQTDRMGIHSQVIQGKQKTEMQGDITARTRLTHPMIYSCIEPTLAFQ